MTRKASASVIILIVLMVISLSLAGGVFYFLQQERLKVMNLTTDLESAASARNIAEQNLKESKKMIVMLEAGVKESQVQIETLTRNLKDETQARKDALAKAEAMQMELDKERTLHSELERKLSAVQMELDKAQVQVKTLSTSKSDLETKIMTLESKSTELEEALGNVQLGKIVVTPSGGVPTDAQSQPQAFPRQASSGVAAERDGLVLVVNKEYKFVVINLGTKDGIAVNDVFSVYHNNKYVGDVKVEQLHEAMAAAGYLSSDLTGKVSEGDKVVKKLR